MRVFDTSTSVIGNAALEYAIHVIVARLTQLDAPRSLCELHLDEDDYQWLCKWANRHRRSRLQLWLEDRRRSNASILFETFNLTYGEAFGVLFLLLASETARREANEGQIWPVVYPRFSSEAQDLLFDFQRQPKATLKDVIVGAADKLSLRHVFGMEGTQEYYVSAYLQFGFTKQGIERIPYWLAGQAMSESVNYLTGMRGWTQRSESFVDLWETLKNYRRNNITDDQARRRLESSPWVLPSWSERLLQEAKQRLDLDTAGASTQEQELDSLSEFLTLPRLRWDGATQPYFLSSVYNLRFFDLSEERYSIRAGDKVVTQLLRTEGETYLARPSDIDFPADGKSVIAEIISESGEAVASQFIDFWDPMEDVELYDVQTGRWVPDAWSQRLTSGREYAMLLSTDLEYSPSDLNFQVMGSSGDFKRFVRFRADEHNPVRVRLDGEDIWTSDRGGIQPRSEREPEWARDVSVRMQPTHLVVLSEEPSRSLYVFGLPAEAVLTFVRIGSMPLNYWQESGGYSTEEFNIVGFASQLLRNYDFPIRIGILMRGIRRTITRTLVLDVSGVLDVTGGGCVVIDPKERLSVREANRATYKVVVPTRYIDELSRLFVMEGGSAIGRFPRRPRQFTGLSGYGAKVWISERNQFNEVLTVAEATYDPGIVKGVLPSGPGQLRVFLEHDLEPASEHQIVFWRLGDAPEIRSARDLVSHSTGSLNEWDIVAGGAFSDDMFVAVAYEGIRLGARLPDHLGAIAHIQERDILLTFAFLRWMQAPVLSKPWYDPLVQLLDQYRDEARQAWYRDDGLPGGLMQKPIEAGWNAVLRQFERYL